jgi:NADH-quinone oxidoreductase subunit N
MVWLAVIAVVFSVIGAFYYLRVVKAMYFDEPAAPVATMPIVATTDMRVALSINGALVLVLGILPQYLLKLCSDAVLRALGG